MKLGLCTIAYRNIDVREVIPHAAKVGFDEIEIIYKQVEGKTDAELDDLLLELRRKQFNMRMQASFEQSVRSSDVRETRRDIARIKTIINERRQGDAA